MLLCQFWSVGLTCPPYASVSDNMWKTQRVVKFLNIKFFEDKFGNRLILVVGWQYTCGSKGKSVGVLFSSVSVE